MVDIEDLKEQIRENFDIPVEEQEEKVFEEYVRLSEASMALSDFRLYYLNEALATVSSRIGDLIMDTFNFIGLILLQERHIREKLQDDYICVDVDEDGYLFKSANHIYDEAEYDKEM